MTSTPERSRIVDQLVDLAQEHGIGSVQTILAHIRDELGMDAAFISEFVDDRQIFRTLEGDAASFDLALDEGPQLDETYCRLLCEREIDPLIPDTHEVEALRSIPATEAVNIRSYLGMPISLPDGRLYGTICALSHEPRPDIKETDLRLLTLAARLIGDEIARRELEEANWALSYGVRGLRPWLRPSTSGTATRPATPMRL